MNICYIYNGHPLVLPPGGIGNRMRRLSLKLTEQGHKVTFIGCNEGLYRKRIIYDDKVKIISLPYIKIPKFHRYFNRYYLSKYIELNQKYFNFELIEMPEYLGWFLPKINNAKKIIRFSSSNGKITNETHKDWWVPFLNETLKNADYFCSVSKFISSAAKDTHQKLNGKKISVLYSGVNTKIFHPELNQKNGKIKILFFGNVNVNKGVFELVEAWNMLNENEKNIQLIICGNDSFDIIKKQSTQDLLVQKLNPDIRHTVKFMVINHDAELAKLIQKSSFVVFPSHSEGFSNALLEAMACQKAVIFSRLGVSKEIIKDGENGLLCKPLCSKDLFQKMRLLIRNVNLRDNLADEALKTIRNNYTGKHFYKRNLDFYNYCISK